MYDPEKKSPWLSLILAILSLAILISLLWLAEYRNAGANDNCMSSTPGCPTAVATGRHSVEAMDAPVITWLRTIGNEFPVSGTQPDKQPESPAEMKSGLIVEEPVFLASGGHQGVERRSFLQIVGASRNSPTRQGTLRSQGRM